MKKINLMMKIGDLGYLVKIYQKMKHIEIFLDIKQWVVEKKNLNVQQQVLI